MLLGRGGSSPRIRGESHQGAPLPSAPGIIPANTGRIGHSGVSFQVGGDHPREYGENANMPLDLNQLPGSSPRIRGEWLLMRLIMLPVGIIPANTGRIRWKSARSKGARDHPREYGENIGSKDDPRTGAGSSPRIRGE